MKRLTPLNEIIAKLKNRHTVNTKTGCWEWIARCDVKGYGIISYNNHHHRAHRLSYKLFIGEIPNGLFICHKCDNRRCINPDHLFAGTAKDNCHDMIKKGRGWWTIGRKPNAKLSYEAAETIRRRFKVGGLTKAQLAVEYGVRLNAIYDVLAMKTWKRENVDAAKEMGLSMDRL